MITDPLAVRFSNEQVRPAADRIAQIFYGLAPALDSFAALGLNTIFVQDSVEIVIDGAETDGRGIITSGDVFKIIQIASLIRQILGNSTDGPLKDVLKVAVNSGSH